MRAIIMNSVGGPEVLVEKDVPTPVPRGRELLIAVKAAGVNPIDYKIRKSGVFGAGPGRILGFDVAGVVHAAGPEAQDFKPGDAVFYAAELAKNGAYAEFHVVDETIVARKPKNLDFNSAAALPTAGLTAWQALIDRCHLTLGQTVLIHGGSGGVGSMAVQLAHAAGAIVFATCSGRNMDLVRSMGADRAIDHKTEDFSQIIKHEAASHGAPAAEPGGAADVVFDCFGGDCVVRSIPITRNGGKIATIVNANGDLSAGYRRNISLEYVFLNRGRAQLETLASLAERGRIKPIVRAVLPLSAAAEAHRQLEAGGGFGKIVLHVAD